MIVRPSGNPGGEPVTIVAGEVSGQAESPSENGHGTPGERAGTPTRRRSRGSRGLRFAATAGGVVLGAFILLFTTAGLWTDWLWFRAIGLSEVLATRYLTAGVLFVTAGFGAALFFGLNVRRARRQLAGGTVTVRGQELPLSRRFVNLTAWLSSAAVGLIFGIGGASNWQLILAFLNRTDFGVREPIYGRDAAFYVFTLPLIAAARSWFLGLFLVTLAVVAALSFLRLTQASAQSQSGRSHELRGQLSLLGALTLATFSLSYWLANYDLLYSTRGVVQGVGRADFAAQRPANWILLVISLLAAFLLAWNTVARHWRALVITLGAWAAAAILVGILAPALYQRLIVRPNEFGQELPYIANNIALTRRAYNLDTVTTARLAGDAPIRQEDLAANAATIVNVRLWDYRPLLTTYRQIQRFRQYYEFDDVDIDRYRLPGVDGATQTMLAARELDSTLLDQRAQTWQNRHLIYTHGYGVVVNPVNQVSGQGQPAFLVQDIPPTGADPLTIAQPQIYYGARTAAYVIVGTGEREFDRPASGSNGGEEYTRYSAGGGVSVGSLPSRLLFAAAFGDPNIVLSTSLTSESQVLYHRTIADRVGRVAPFLTLDHDPYLVILDGRLIWIQDAYTATDRFPYSTPAADLGPNGAFNYIRNSVKVTVDAYTGEMRFYVVDEQDPLLQTYRKIFPSLFTPLSAAPDGLVEHFRYPEDLFNAQADIYRRYHMTDPQTFYSQEDLWNVAQETYAERIQRMQAYYVTMRLPEQDHAEFALILPYTPAGPGRNNMLAWLAARADGPHYGELQAYAFPQGSNILGPQQVEARINQEPEISAQLTLLNQAGSSVIRGNLLVFPLGDALLYVQPLYLQATTNPLPEFERVIVASSNPNQGVVMSDRLDTALGALVQGRHGIVLGGQSTSGAPGTSAGGDLAAQAWDHLARAQAAAQRGDWATYGQELAELERVLRQLTGR